MRRGAQLKECAEMKSVLVSLVAVGAYLVIFSPSVASAANPPGTGQPNQTCQNFVVSGSVLATPGQHSGTVVQGAANSPGSVFNEPGFGSTSGGTGGITYNNVGAPSQYDVACFQQTQIP
jgi:hypothetical protein